MRGSALQTPKLDAEGGGGGVKSSRAVIPLQPMVQTRVRHMSPCSSWGFMGKQRSTCSPWRTPDIRAWMPKGGCKINECSD